MPDTAKPRRPRKHRLMDTAEQLAARDEILQVMFWLRGEGLAHEVAPADLAKWVGLSGGEIEPLLVQMLGSRLVERVVVDSGAEEGVPRFRLTASGMREGQRRFAEEFSEFTGPRHFEHSDPDCDCENVSRFSVSLKKGLFRQLDEMIEQKGYENRSLAIADMIRDKLVDHWQEAGEFDAVGTIMVAFDPRDRQVRATFANLQEQYLETIVSTLRVQTDPHSGMEVLVVRGKAAAIKVLADRLIGAKGVKHGKLSLTATTENLSG
ncbi:MAG: nickel-responsive transcriptional regulator NikR [Chthoniobacterales bacterium]